MNFKISVSFARLRGKGPIFERKANRFLLEKLFKKNHQSNAIFPKAFDTQELISS